MGAGWRLIGCCALLALAGCQKAPPAATAAAVATSAAVATAARPAAPAPGAPHVTGVELGNAIDAIGRVAIPSLRFASTDTIHASITFDGRDLTQAHKIGVRWTFEPGAQPVLAEAKMLAFTGPGDTAFSIRKPDGWPAGNYKLRVLLDGVLAQTREFEVQGQGPPPAETAAPSKPTPTAPPAQ